ncbi:alpha/beta fold hydrolase [Flavobacterium hiemivividum]|uniref:Alpha/beta hydrolase n=1 Tax=Flavobacterium hiemivividum TaxID=2541734 RepID=A0A4V2Z161_9FLAO|nr:alpha/beta hydrolase [Flavobacterium hiemivividum]TDE03588.1 alpha/beta hydrolase [Flavobacterium hiemivividum]
MKTAANGFNRTIDLKNVSISYDDLGEGAIPVIFLHGFPFNKSTWKSQLESLQSSRRVIAFDLRGFGKSHDEKTALSIDLFTSDLIEFMDKLAIEKAIICGLSMGGYIALNAIHKYPERFEALILCDTQCIADTAEGKEKRYKAIDEIENGGLTEFYEGFIKKLFHKDSISSKKEIVANLSTVVFSNSQSSITRGLIAMAERSETCSTLGQISIPTLIICGREDELTPLEQSEFMNGKIKNSKLKVIDNAGHVSNLEQPAEFNNYLSNFLNELS